MWEKLEASFRNRQRKSHELHPTPLELCVVEIITYANELLMLFRTHLLKFRATIRIIMIKNSMAIATNWKK